VVALVSVEISLIGMVVAIAAVIAIGTALRLRYAFLSGGLIAIGGLWLVATLPALTCEASAAACGNPNPMIGVSAAVVLAGLFAGVATARHRSRMAP